MKKILKKSLHILCTTLGIIPFMLTSCNYLAVDEYFNDLTPLDSIFARQDYLERYVWGTAALMPAQGNLFSGSYGPYETAVDEVLLSWQKAEYAGTYLYADKITQNDSYYNMWGQYYKGIRKCNTIFTRIDECKDLKGLDRREIMGLTHFMRASFYFYLLELYGPVPLLPDEGLDYTADYDDLAIQRSSYDECVEYICKDLEEAYSLLDPTRPSTQFERPTKYAAAALMSRVRLYQASKWYNGNQYYADWTTSDGRNMIAQQYDPVKWAKSAAASKRIIDSGIYSLYTVPSDENTYASSQASQAEFPLGVGGIDPYHSYIDMFNGEIISYNLSETPNMEQIYDMLDKAFSRNDDLEGLILHSDQGWQYQHYGYRQRLEERNVVQSMSRKGNCLDNAMAESANGAYKTELVWRRKPFQDLRDLELATFRWVSWWNSKRLHQSLGCRTPEQIETEYHANQAAQAAPL